MSRPAARSLALLLGLVLAGTAVALSARIVPHHPLRGFFAPARCAVFPDPAARLQEEAPPRNARALAELEQLRDHPWAGIYRTPGRWPTELVIAPEAGFTLYRGSYCGTCARWIGIGKVVAVAASRLELEIERGEFPPEAERSASWYQLDETLHLVKWGELEFAVPSWRMDQFCAEASDGYSFPIVPFLRRGAVEGFDSLEPSRPVGEFEVPSEYRHLLLDEPVTCRVASLLACRPRSERRGEREVYDAVYALDAGSEDGLAVGMRLYVEGQHFSGRVERVELASARLELLAGFEEERAAQSLVGRPATTLHPKARR